MSDDLDPTPQEIEAAELEQAGWAFIGIAMIKHANGRVTYHGHYASSELMATKREYGGLA